MEDIVSDKQDIVIGRFRLRTWPRGLGIDIGNRSVNINSGDRARIKKRQAGA